MFTKEWYNLLDILSSEETDLDILSLDHIRACSAAGIFGCLVFDVERPVECLFCGGDAQEDAKPCEHVRLSADNKDGFPELRQKLQQCECRIF
ncbi:hypothetical protein DOTSEDRAFT_73069 [Dothistroma septosporum NZE10]|uniref:Uncharacterized protein n=1 Tax=Dothistroma septosporum (strain NZE10 / CBS 128990) TaxID=675120 RepID=N1PJ72_DOTSN|nr:hypothetical protein DOTSEDRAFT_73069 [Dothistroma septosporum NZE10]